jgi:hypothetical protein
VALRRLARNPGAAATALALSLTIQSSFVLLNRMLGQAIGIEVPVAVWFLVWPLAKIAGLMPISLGGLAIREATLAALLAPFGVPFAVGVVCSLLWQTVLIVGGLLGGLAWLVLDRTTDPPGTLGRRRANVSTGASSSSVPAAGLGAAYQLHRLRRGHATVLEQQTVVRATPQASSSMACRSITEVIGFTRPAIPRSSPTSNDSSALSCSTGRGTVESTCAGG